MVLFKIVIAKTKNQVEIPQAKGSLIMGWEDPLEKRMATHSSLVAWEMDRRAWWDTVHGMAKRIRHN